MQGSWRHQLTPLDLSDAQILFLTPQITASGASALIYRRLELASPLFHSSALRLRTTYQENAAHGTRLLYHIGRIFSALDAEKIEPILFKGWAVARLYPDWVLRPLGDIDLFVPPDSEMRTQQVLASLNLEGIPVDLHTQVADTRHATQLVHQSLDDLYARSRVVDLSGISVRVLSPEDHLHLLSMHFMRHGGWRALWLCDIAVALETRPADFDWELCLDKGQVADWIACALVAAHELVGAQLDQTPSLVRERRLPGWFIPSILAEWSNTDSARHYPPEPIRKVWKEPRRLLRALRARWVNPLEATMLMNGAMSGTPRAWYQSRFLLQKSLAFLARSARSGTTSYAE